MSPLPPSPSCVIAELFLDGRPLFNLSQLLEYCNGDREHFESSMKQISDRLIRVSMHALNWTPPLYHTPLLRSIRASSKLDSSPLPHPFIDIGYSKLGL